MANDLVKELNVFNVKKGKIFELNIDDLFEKKIICMMEILSKYILVNLNFIFSLNLISNEVKTNFIFLDLILSISRLIINLASFPVIKIY